MTKQYKSNYKYNFKNTYRKMSIFDRFLSIIDHLLVFFKLIFSF